MNLTSWNSWQQRQRVYRLLSELCEAAHLKRLDEAYRLGFEDGMGGTKRVDELLCQCAKCLREYQEGLGEAVEARR